MTTLSLRSFASAAGFGLCLSLVASACGSSSAPQKESGAPTEVAEKAPENAPPPEEEEPPLLPPSELVEPVELWKAGKVAGYVDAQGPATDAYLFVDLGEGFTPILFSDGVGAQDKPLPHAFRETYLALARGEFPDDIYGERARDDKYLELYGIMPTLGVLRKRLKWALNLECSKHLDLTALENFTGVIAYQGQEQALKTRTQYLVARNVVRRILEEQGLEQPEQIDLEALSDKDKWQVKYYLKTHGEFEAIKAAQERLACEGYFKGKGKWTKGAFDWPTHEALAEFERRHRVYSWGAMGRETKEALRMDTAAVEHETVIRVLTERAMHAFGAIEDGSAQAKDGSPIRFKGADGKEHEVPNLEAALRDAVVSAFGLTSPEATFAFLEKLGKLEPDGHRRVAIRAPRRPEYYSDNMDLTVSIDRGDVWYEFPYDENGKEKPQPVSYRPRMTIFVNYLGQRIPLATFGTTIGGWRSELIDNTVWWKYKGSPVGEVLWQEIVSAPVWLPPSTTPPRELLKRRRDRKPGETKWEPNYHETGPSYASAYGLVAAYHRPFVRKPDGSLRIMGDEGIRSHGSVDYMSIMRRHSHGCHRLHNHIAVRLFSFVLSHRAHTREGHQSMAFYMPLEYENEKHAISIKRGGYVFRLAEPIFVTVEEGRIRGSVDKPILTPIPKYHDECQGYYLPDGTAVVPKPNGVLVPVNKPPCPAIVKALPPPPPVVANQPSPGADGADEPREAAEHAPSAALPRKAPGELSAMGEAREVLPTATAP